uniref:NTR domain-containing protein n=1 Tax=Meloidogyne hapla TaxID=6305 RepID=A0A1I8B5P5_MELHA
MSIEQKYCGSDWIARVKSVKRQEVRDKEGWANEFRYIVKILRTYKASDSKTCNLAKIDCVYSATQSAACGVSLKDGQEYLLFAAHILTLKSELIQEGEQWDWKLRYTVKFLKVFKGEEDCQYEKNYYLFTSANDGLCGVNLKNNTEYLNFGYYINDKRNIGLCEYNNEWNFAPEEIKEDLNNGEFDNYCETKTSTTKI